MVLSKHSKQSRGIPYSKIIERFPHGGGGYIVATHTLGKSAGVVSGSALLIDYVLTITVSIAACGDAIFSFLPLEFHQYSLLFKVSLIFILIILNLRGIKESVTVLAPIFLLFIITHIILLGYGIFSQASAIFNRNGKRSAGNRAPWDPCDFPSRLLIRRWNIYWNRSSFEWSPSYERTQSKDR